MIVHSHYAQEKTVETYRLGRNAKKIRVIPHGNYIGNYPNTLTNEQARNKLGVSYEKKVFLFLGQIRSYKGLPELIAAFSKISKGSELLILAGKPLDEQIETEIAEMTKGRKDIIYSPEFVSDEDIQIYMKAADVVVFPFRDIFTSGSVLLAMSFSKALIIPDLESLEEIKRVGGVIIYNPDDWSGLEKALFEALTDELVKKGLLNFNEAQRLSWDSIAEETFELYKKAL
jgi:glycosyltransferase involved in cell wall biosynthesis